MKATAAQWRGPTSWAVVCARAAGRKRWNAVRALRTQLRRAEVVEFMLRDNLGMFDHGVQARIARAFGVNRSTIHRDVQAIIAMAALARAEGRCCPVCRGPLVPRPAGVEG